MTGRGLLSRLTCGPNGLVKFRGIMAGIVRADLYGIATPLARWFGDHRIHKHELESRTTMSKIVFSWSYLKPILDKDFQEWRRKKNLGRSALKRETCKDDTYLYLKVGRSDNLQKRCYCKC